VHQLKSWAQEAEEEASRIREGTHAFKSGFAATKGTSQPSFPVSSTDMVGAGVGMGVVVGVDVSVSMNVRVSVDVGVGVGVGASMRKILGVSMGVGVG